jgi:nucleoside phosphorylase
MPDPTFTLPPVPARVRKVLLFVALRSEAEPIARALGATCGSARVGDALVEFVVPGADPALDIDRVGPIHAANVLTRAIAMGRPDLVLNMGTAGGFESQGLGIADLVVARDCMFHDARVALPGYDALARAHTRLSPTDAQLGTIADRLPARVGLASTGSSLDATAGELELFARENTLAKDMELAALAIVCRDERIPLAALKGITDLVDHHEPTQDAFLRNLARTSDRVAEAARPFIESLVS